MTQATISEDTMDVHPAEIVREYGPFSEGLSVGGVTFDGAHVWFAAGETLRALEPESGEVIRTFEVPSDAGTAFDGSHVYQIAGSLIQKIDPKTGAIVATIPAPGNGSDSGLTWAEGSLWVGEHRGRKIHQIDPETGVVLRTIESNRFVTGVTWVEGELWHGTWEGSESDLRRIDPANGKVLTRLLMPSGTGISGLESDGAELFYAGGGGTGKVRAIARRRSAQRKC